MTQVLILTLHNANYNEHYTNWKCHPKLSMSLTFENVIKDELSSTNRHGRSVQEELCYRYEVVRQPSP